MAGASFAAAWAYPAFGPSAYWIGVVLTVVGLIAAETMRRLWRGGQLSVST
jgi:hypothetical protein